MLYVFLLLLGIFLFFGGFTGQKTQLTDSLGEVRGVIVVGDAKLDKDIYFLSQKHNTFEKQAVHQ